MKHEIEITAGNPAKVIGYYAGPTKFDEYVVPQVGGVILLILLVPIFAGIVLLTLIEAAYKYLKEARNG
jgi:hypothetical protein